MNDVLATAAVPAAAKPTAADDTKSIHKESARESLRFSFLRPPTRKSRHGGGGAVRRGISGRRRRWRQADRRQRVGSRMRGAGGLRNTAGHASRPHGHAADGGAGCGARNVAANAAAASASRRQPRTRCDLTRTRRRPIPMCWSRPARPRTGSGQSLLCLSWRTW